MRIVKIEECPEEAYQLVYFDNPKQVWILFYDGEKLKFMAADLINVPNPTMALLRTIRKYLCE